MTQTLNSHDHVFKQSAQKRIAGNLCRIVNRDLLLLEIKSAKTPDSSMANGIRKFAKFIPNVRGGHVIYSGEEWPLEGGSFTNFRDVSKLIQLKSKCGS